LRIIILVCIFGLKKIMVLEALTGGLDLSKFTNAELYYLISGALCDGDPGYTPEKLYVSFDQSNLGSVPEIKFLFITVTMFEGVGQEGNRECRKAYLGRIDSEFDDIEICCANYSPEQLDLKEKLDFPFVTGPPSLKIMD
jgi:hypothetical protein